MFILETNCSSFFCSSSSLLQRIQAPLAKFSILSTFSCTKPKKYETTPKTIIIKIKKKDAPAIIPKSISFALALKKPPTKFVGSNPAFEAFLLKKLKPNLGSILSPPYYLSIIVRHQNQMNLILEL